MQVISRNGNNTFSVPLSGTGTAAGALSATPGTESFGNVTAGNSSTLPGTLTTSGASVTISGSTTTNSEFSISGITFPLTLSAGKSAAFNVIFSPGSSGATTGVLTFNSSANSASQSLTGTGVSAPQHSVSLFWDARTSVVTDKTSIAARRREVHAASLDALTSYIDMSVVAGSS